MSATLASSAALSVQELEWLDRAERLAVGGWGSVHPNPMVGCLIVKGDHVVGEGFHEIFGGSHAEVIALSQAGSDARGSTAYVSLEPCNHHGQTPPCVDALVEAGVSRVVYGAADPGAESAGGGARLAAAGLDVAGPVRSPAVARQQNPAFFHNAEQASTYVALKLAVSLDGRISGAPGGRTTITGPEAHDEVHRLRAGFDAIMVGSKTVDVDDPLLTVRGSVIPRVPPTRIVLDTTLRLEPDAALFRDVETAPVIVFTADDAADERARRLEAAGANVVPVARSEDGLDLLPVMDHCWKAGITSVLCEGGGFLGSTLIRARIARRLYLFVAPVVLGDGGVPAFPALTGLDSPRRWQTVGSPTRFGEDVLTILCRRD